MKGKSCLVYYVSQSFSFYNKHLFRTTGFCSVATVDVSEQVKSKSTTTLKEEIFRKWGCSEKQVAEIFRLGNKSLQRATVSNLRSKLDVLSKLGLTPSDMVQAFKWRNFFNTPVNHRIDERVAFFMNMFGSRNFLAKAFVRYPRLLTLDIEKTVIPTLALYEKMGVSRNEMVPIILSRPALVCRTVYLDENVEYIKKIGVSKDSKMYKYVVSILGTLRHENICEKVENFKKFGYSEEEIFSLFGKTPHVMTLSVDKVHRAMTFILETVKLPKEVVFIKPVLLLVNLDTVLKPRVLVMQKIHEMGLAGPDLEFDGKLIAKLSRIKETQFLNSYVMGHQENVTNELLEYYKHVKGGNDGLKEI